MAMEFFLHDSFFLFTRNYNHKVPNGYKNLDRQLRQRPKWEIWRAGEIPVKSILLFLGVQGWKPFYTGDGPHCLSCLFACLLACGFLFFTELLCYNTHVLPLP